MEGVNINELGAGLRPAAEAKPPPKLRAIPPLLPLPPPPPTFKDGRGRAGLLAQDPAGLEVPEDIEGGGPALTLFSRPGMVRAFILARISSVMMMVGLGNELLIHCVMATFVVYCFKGYGRGWRAQRPSL